jgi:hypothetical protein
MPLDATQKQAIQDWFNRKCPTHQCPACGARHWSIGNVVGLPEVDLIGPAATQTTGNMIVSILRACNDCGYMAHFSLYAILKISAAGRP